MKNIFKILRTELHRILHNYDILLIILAAPVFYALFYGSVYINKLETNVSVAFVDEDKSELSRKIADDIDAHPSLNITSMPVSLEQAKSELINGNVQGIIIADKGLSNNLKSHKHGYISLYLNTNRFLAANDINKAVNEIVSRYNYGIRLKYFESTGTNTTIAMQNIIPIKYDIRPVFNISESYGDFLIPGVLILILQQTLLIGLGVSTATYNSLRKNDVRELITKTLLYIVIYSIFALIFFTVIVSIFKIEYSGSTIAGVLLTLIFLINVAIMAILLGLLIKNKFFILILIAFSSYPIFLLSGYSWQMSWMPKILIPFSYLFPSTPYLNGMLKLISKGAGFSHIIKELLAMTVQTILLLTITQLTNQKQINEV